MDARSGVGASGLMQIMPATARWTAKKIGLPYTPALIADRDTNLRARHRLPEAGARRLRRLAGAGRGRLQRRPGPAAHAGARAAARAGDLGREHPVPETRDYVKKVLSNATYYAALMGDSRRRTEAAAGPGASARPTLARRRTTGPARRRPEPRLADPMANMLVLGGTGFVGRARLRKARRALRRRRRRASSCRAGARPRTPALAAAHRRAGAPPTSTTTPTCAQLVATLRLRSSTWSAILHGSEAAFDRVHVQLPRRLAQACASGGVQPRRPCQRARRRRRAPSRYLRSKAAGEAALAAKGLDLTVLRPSVMFGEGDRFLNLFARLQAVFPVIPLAGADARFQPVWVEDVAKRDRPLPRRPDDDRRDHRMLRTGGLHAARSWCSSPGAASGQRPPGGRAARRARSPAGQRDGIAARRAADVARQPRLHAGRQRRQSASIQAWRGSASRPAALEAIAPLYLGEGQGPARLDSWREAMHRR